MAQQLHGKNTGRNRGCIKMGEDVVGDLGKEVCELVVSVEEWPFDMN